MPDADSRLFTAFLCVEDLLKFVGGRRPLKYHLRQEDISKLFYASKTFHNCFMEKRAFTVFLLIEGL